MPPKRKTEPEAPSTMKELKDTLWKAADKLRGSLSANQYKDVILGLVFLKYVSDAYDERRDAIRADLAAEGYDEDQIAELIDDPEEYQGYGVFVVPPAARWAYLAENAKGKPARGTEPERTIGSADRRGDGRGHERQREPASARCPASTTATTSTSADSAS